MQTKKQRSDPQIRRTLAEGRRVLGLASERSGITRVINSCIQDFSEIKLLRTTRCTANNGNLRRSNAWEEFVVVAEYVPKSPSDSRSNRSDIQTRAVDCCCLVFRHIPFPCDLPLPPHPSPASLKPLVSKWTHSRLSLPRSPLAPKVPSKSINGTQSSCLLFHRCCSACPASASAYVDNKNFLVVHRSPARRDLIDKMLARYSSDHVVLRELLQNADDARATDVEFRFSSSVAAGACRPCL